MFEAIAANRRRSLVLISLMAFLLIALGASIGGAIHPRDGVWIGAAAALVVWLIMWLTAVTSGDSVLISAAGAHELSKEDAPQLWNVVEEMTIAAGLPKMPRVYLVDDAAPNAFAVGSDPRNAALVVTAGLLKRLNRDELQGVIGHEIGHICNEDVKFLTQASVMIGAIVFISDLFLRGFLRGGGGRRSSSSSKDGGAAVIFVIVAVVLAALAPLAAQLLYFACSRRREFLADATSAKLTRFPPGLAGALTKISSQCSAMENVQRVVSPLYIVNPLQENAVFSIFSTHPPTKERVKILLSMAGAGLAAYEAAFAQARGGGHCVPGGALQGAEQIAIRTAAADVDATQEAVARAQAVGELLDRVTQFVVIKCGCGAKLKVPPDFKSDSIECPRCGKSHAVPTAMVAAPPRAPAAPPAMRYQRTGQGGWEGFRCTCGTTVQLSPKFSGDSVNCPRCKKRIAVEPAGTH